MKTRTREEKNIAFMKAYGAGGSRIEEFERLYKRDTSNQFFDQRLIDGVELIYKMYSELLESLLQSFMPRDILGNEDDCKKWILDNKGTIMRDSIHNRDYIYIGGKCKGYVTTIHESPNSIRIEWTPNK